MILSSTCFEQPSVHPQEDFYMQVYQTYPDIGQTAYTNAWKNSVKQHVQVFLRMNTWYFETCQSQC